MHLSKPICLLLLQSVLSVFPTHAFLLAQESRIADTPTQVIQHLRNKDLNKALDVLGNLFDLEILVDQSKGQGIEAAIGGVCRVVSQLSPEEQYERLYRWTFPTSTRNSVRVLTSIVPQVAPPIEFARVLGERPRATSFTIASVGEFRGLFCSAWLLVQSAKESGRLRKLTTELETLVAGKAPNAESVLLLARLADDRGDDAALKTLLGKILEELKSPFNNVVGEVADVRPVNLVIAAAACQRESLRSMSEEIFAEVLKTVSGKVSSSVKAFVRAAHATAVQLHRGASGPEALRNQQLKYWIAASGATTLSDAEGSVPAIWLTHEEHLLHLCGSGNDVLLLRYPIIGDFEFRCETQEGGDIQTDGGLLYGGLQFEALGSTKQLSVWDASMNLVAQKPCPFVRHEDRATFNRVSIQSTDEKAIFAANLHPMWFDSAVAKASPWLGLRSFSERRPVFRNLSLAGKPEIPREVRMVESNELRGWITNSIQAPNVDTSKVATSPERIVDGVLHGDRISTDDGGSSECLLSYQRPLLENESVSYEYFYEPEVTTIHPALGRLAFLIEPEGIRIHWVTSGDKEWTGLTPDNVAMEPLNRRGPKPLPLKIKDWNRVQLSRDAKGVSIALNDVVIYQRPIDWNGDLRFGLYRDQTKSAMQVRNIVMKGDWPEVLPDEFLKNPVALAGGSPNDSNRHATQTIVGESVIASNAHAARKLAQAMSREDRIAFLTDWLLPMGAQIQIRLSGAFTQTHPIPSGEKRAGDDLGGSIVAPLYDLLQVIPGTKQAEALRKRILAMPEPTDSYNKRSRVALLAILDLQENQSTAVVVAIEELLALNQLNDTETSEVTDAWPELLLVDRLIARNNPVVTEEVIVELLELLIARNLEASTKAHLAALLGKAKVLAMRKSGDEAGRQQQMRDWIPISAFTAQTRGDGLPVALWEKIGSQVFHVTGHHDDCLFYKSPLNGNFDFECDVSLPAVGTCDVMIGGTFVGPRPTLDEFARGAFGGERQMRTISPPMTKRDLGVHLRATSQGGSSTAAINGRIVHRKPSTERNDPWIAIHSPASYHGNVQDVRIGGTPNILEQVSLLTSSTLTGWFPYYDEMIGLGGNANWSYAEDFDADGRIVGSRSEEIDGSFSESLLRYQMPLSDDGSIDYEFYYERGKSETHPALDRLVFLLEPAGVDIHWLTDGLYDRTNVPPDNRVREKSEQRGPERLPLVENAWNRMQLKLQNDVVELILNGQLVYQRKIEESNQRTFGLFHYADQSQVLVRNCVMRGNWRREVPDVAHQELAGNPADILAADLPRLKSVFHHDFRTAGTPPQYIKPVGRAKEFCSQSSNGLHVSNLSFNATPALKLSLPFSLHGDFDVTVSFDELMMTPVDGHNIVHLMIALQDSQQHQIMCARGKGTNRQQVKGQVSVPVDGGKRRSTDTFLGCEANAGTLRIARRGTTCHMLFAEGDSSHFRCIGTEKVTDADVAFENVSFGINSGPTAGRSSVVFKSISVRAERMMLQSPEQDTKVLQVMKADGSELRTIVGTVPEYRDMIAPEWFANDSKISLVMRNTNADSHMFVMNADGSDLKDLGPGCNPSFSPDGKQLAFGASGNGAMMMDANGQNRNVIDPLGWSPQWSPDGQWIAYTKEGNVILWNPKTKQGRPLFVGEQAQRFNYCYWDLGWSNDSRSIGVQARNQKTSVNEVVVVDIDDPKTFEVLYAGPGITNPDVSWSPDHQSITIPIKLSGQATTHLYTLTRGKPGLPKLLSGQPLDDRVNDCDWSRDGQLIIFSRRPSSEPIEWTGNQMNAGKQ